MTEQEQQAWELKHQLIVESINENHDFDLDAINKKVQEIMAKERK